MKKQTTILLSLFTLTAFTFTACGTKTTDGTTLTVQKTQIASEEASASSDETKTEEVNVFAEETTSEYFTDRDYEVGYSDEITITLSDSGSTADGDGASVSGSTVTITAGGTYLLTGSLSDGQVVVDVDDSEKVHLVLDNVSITNSSSAAIYVKSADKVFFTTVSGTTNTLQTTGEFVQTDENNIDGAIFAKSTITLNGEGTLVIKSTAHGIVSKDNLKVTSGTYEITSTKAGLSGKDSVRIAGGTFTISAGTKGIKSENNDDADKGWVYISGGDITVTESSEAIEGAAITIDGGNLDLTASDDGMNVNVTGGTLIINGGTIKINATGDGLDSNGNLVITGGTIYDYAPGHGGDGIIDCGDGGYAATITGGTFLGLGVSGMNENFGSASTIGSILTNLSGSYGAGSTVTLSDSDGNVILETTGIKSFNSVLFASTEIRDGETYTITVDGDTQTITMDGLQYGESFGGMGGGFGGGRMGGFKQWNTDGETQDGRSFTPPTDGEQPNGEMPQQGNFKGGRGMRGNRGTDQTDISNMF